MQSTMAVSAISTAAAGMQSLLLVPTGSEVMGGVLLKAHASIVICTVIVSTACRRGTVHQCVVRLLLMLRCVADSTWQRAECCVSSVVSFT